MVKYKLEIIFEDKIDCMAAGEIVLKTFPDVRGFGVFKKSFEGNKKNTILNSKNEIPRN